MSYNMKWSGKLGIAIKVLLAGAIMTWIGFFLILWLIVPIFMLVFAPLQTVQMLYWAGFLPSCLAAIVYYSLVEKVGRLLGVGLSAMAGGASFVAWLILLGIPVYWHTEPSFFTVLSIVATAIYFTVVALASGKSNLGLPTDPGKTASSATGLGA